MLVGKIIVLSFAVGMFILSVRMITRPDAFAVSIRRFADWQYFHSFEIISRLIFALGFYLASSATEYSWLYLFISLLLVLVVIFLLVLGRRRHINFAHTVSEKVRTVLIPSGMCAILFSLFLIFSLWN